MTPEQIRKLSYALQRLARKIERDLEQTAGARVLFSLHVWGSGASGEIAQYVSNAEREDVVKALRELLGYWDKGMPDIPAHERQ